MKNFQFDDNRIVGPMGQYYATLLGASEQFKEFLLNAINRAEMPKEKKTIDNNRGIPEYFLSKDGCEKKIDICYGDCEEPVKRDWSSGRWFITMGHPGFNCATNNGDGYKHKAAALRAIARYGSKRGAA